MPDPQTASPWWASEQAKGSRSLILSSLAFSLMTVCVKQLNGRIPVTEIVLVRAIISLALTGMGLRLAGVQPWGTAKARGLLFARGIAGSMALLCFFQAIDTLPPRRCNGVAVHLPNVHRPRSPVLARGILAQKNYFCGVAWLGGHHVCGSTGLVNR